MKQLLLALAFLVVKASPLQAQRKDSLAVFREFLAKCNGYKQMPLYMEVGFRQQCNLPFSVEDTVSATAVFNIQQNGAYIRFGPMEQVINDSLVLTIMDNVKQMVLSETQSNVSDLLRAVTGSPLADTSVQKIAEKYIAEEKSIGNNKQQILIRNRRLIYSTPDSQDEVVMLFNTQTGIPESITTVRRLLIPDQKYENFDPAVLSTIRKVSFNGKDTLLVREIRAIYDYKELSHDVRKLPVIMSDRVELNEEKQFTPVKNYSEYSLIIN